MLLVKWICLIQLKILAQFKEKLREDYPIFPISAVTREGIRELLFAIADKIEETPEFPLAHDEDEDKGVHRVLYKHEIYSRMNLKLHVNQMAVLMFLDLKLNVYSK